MLHTRRFANGCNKPQCSKWSLNVLVQIKQRPILHSVTLNDKEGLMPRRRFALF